MNRSLYLPSKLHSLVRAGDLAGLRALLERSPQDLNTYDRFGRTPLMCAVESPNASIELAEFLIGMGAKVADESHDHVEQRRSVLALAIRAGDTQKVALLIENGADVFYTHTAGYDALLDVAYSVNASHSLQLIDLIKLLVARGCALNTESTYNERALSALSCLGRFDAIQILLDAGADPLPLGWKALHRSLALGSLEEVRKLIDSGAGIEDRDKYNRTPFLLAVQTGDIAKAEFLLQRGAKSRARGHCGTPAFFYAIENHHAEMFDWLLRIGADIEQTNDFGATPLMTSAEHNNSPAVRALLAAGANLEAECNSETAIALARSRDIITQLLDAGADPRQLGHEGRRILIGLGEASEDPLLDISEEQFLADCSPRYGMTNPERTIAPFWEAMIRSGVNAYLGAQICNPKNKVRPVWCADRFGQSLTRLGDGRIIQIAGEHEDSYDEDFCIYNDVFVHRRDGTVHIFGYPEDVFPPTDFHSATLIGKYVYIIGSLGYQGTRQFGETPVFRLDTDTLHFDQLHPTGEAPGWISRHRAIHVSSHEIRIIGGSVAIHDGREETHLLNDQVFILDTQNLIWRRE